MPENRNQITFTASDELRDALEIESFQNDESRASTIRAILADHLREAGLMSFKAPPLRQLGQHNRRYNAMKGGLA